MKKKIAIKTLKRLLNEGSGISTMGIPRDIEEMITDWMNRDYDGFYVELAAFLNENYRGSCLDFLEHWYDKSLIEQNWPDTEYPWYSHEKFDLWGDGVELGGELEDSDPYSDEMTNPDPAVIGPLIEKYVDHADTDFWKFLYANFGDKLANWLEEVNGSTLVKENKMKRLNENQKVTLTIGQLRKLVNESYESYLNSSGMIDIKQTLLSGTLPDVIDSIIKRIEKVNNWIKENPNIDLENDPDASAEINWLCDDVKRHLRFFEAGCKINSEALLRDLDTICHKQ